MKYKVTASIDDTVVSTTVEATDVNEAVDNAVELLKSQGVNPPAWVIRKVKAL